MCQPRRESLQLISESLNAAINQQIGHELANANQYTAIATYFDDLALFALAKIYTKQSEEEREHALKFVKFLVDTGGKTVIPAIAAVKNDFASAEDAAQTALDYETRTTEQIYKLMDLAIADKNHIAIDFLKWFVAEQLEEVASATDRLQIIKRAGPNVLMVEAYLAHYTS
jgi:ferritin